MLIPTNALIVKDYFILSGKVYGCLFSALAEKDTPLFRQSDLCSGTDPSLGTNFITKHVHGPQTRFFKNHDEGCRKSSGCFYYDGVLCPQRSWVCHLGNKKTGSGSGQGAWVCSGYNGWQPLFQTLWDRFCSFPIAEQSANGSNCSCFDRRAFQGGEATVNRTHLLYGREGRRAY